MRALDVLRQELRLAWRNVTRGRGSATAAVVTLTLGIATTTAMFALVDGVLLRPLPVRDQSSLSVVWRQPLGTSGTHVPFAAKEIDTLHRDSRTLEGAAGVSWHGAGPFAVVEAGEATYLRIAPVTGTFFEVLGTSPVLGRALQPLDDVKGAARALVISHGAWQRRYGGARDAIGRRLFINQQPFVVAGVMPPGLDYPRGTEAWATVAALASAAANETFAGALASELDAVVRYRTGITADQTAQELRRLVPRQIDTAGSPELTPVLRSFDSAVFGDVRTAILALFSGVVLVLLLACGNVATLLLMRGEARVPELAVRTALGAGRMRLAAQMLLESLALSATAAALAVPVAMMLLRVLMAWAPPGLPRADTVTIDLRVAGFCAALAVVVAAAAALVPMLAIVRGRLALNPGKYGRVTGAARTGRQLLVAGQLALTVTVVATTLLLAETVRRLDTIDAGMDVGRLVVVPLSVPQETTSDRGRHLRLLNDIVARLEAAGPIAQATPINALPFTGIGWSVPQFTAEGQDAARAAANQALDLEAVHPGYFETLGVQLTRGRAFESGDREASLPVAIVSEDVAARTWPGQDPIGRRLKMGEATGNAPWLTVVGVARSARYRDLTKPLPVMYVPAEQLIVAAQALVVRSTAPLADTAAAVRAAVPAVDPGVHVMAVQPLDELRQAPLAQPRFTASLSGTFAFAALLLSAIGVFAVTAASVQQRGGELRVRMALGATPAAVQRLVLGEGLRLAALGTGIGALGALAAARAVPDLLFGVQPSDPRALAGAAGVLLLAALLSCAIPAWRASRMNPVDALRQD
ncbi:MAG TPA: ADOP family duplicated permease [Vicinamibacterales bacterium]|nr:ADOP family duplicated permease [Vicinamibacterales bacterium]